MQTRTIVLSAEAVAVVAGLLANESQDINREGIYSVDSVWAEIREAFPITVFREWAERHPYNGIHGYDPDAGY